LSRFRIPPRIAPSPADEEPGQQNAVARLRSSREAQSRLLAERRGNPVEECQVRERLDSRPTAGPAETAGNAGKREGEADRSLSIRSTGISAAKGKKVKLVLLYRLPLTFEPDLADIAARDGVTMEYVLAALARQGRERLRKLAGETDVRHLTDEAAGFERLTEGIKVIGNPMTVYVRPEALEAMHRAAGDPWCSLPRATVVGGYFTAIVARLIKARRAG
jgi:hypothetical protein